VTAARLPQEDELKYVTVLFADIVDSTALIADVSPDEAQFLLTPAVRIILESVCEFGGTVNRIVGDGVLAVFGFPHSQEDHALRACCAAQRMQQEAVQLGAPASLRIGLASGLALLSADDETVLGTPVAFGVTVHLAARLQAMTRPGTAPDGVGRRSPPLQRIAAHRHYRSGWCRRARCRPEVMQHAARLLCLPIRLGRHTAERDVLAVVVADLSDDQERPHRPRDQPGQRQHPQPSRLCRPHRDRGRLVEALQRGPRLPLGQAPHWSEIASSLRSSQ
jgi:hypothetical protein